MGKIPAITICVYVGDQLESNSEHNQNFGLRRTNARINSAVVSYFSCFLFVFSLMALQYLFYTHDFDAKWWKATGFKKKKSALYSCCRWDEAQAW
jgi:hypothetical protein